MKFILRNICKMGIIQARILGGCIMELKTNETNYSYDNETEKTYSNPNDALFKSMEADEPYRVTSTYSNIKPQKNNIANIIISIAIVVVCLGVIGFIYMQKHKCDGTYELSKVEANGVVYTVEEVEAALLIQFGTPMTYDSSIKIDGKKAIVTFNVTGMMEDEFDTAIDISGNKIEFINTSPRLYGDYNPDTKEITLEVNGNAMIYEKVD